VDLLLFIAYITPACKILYLNCYW